MVRIASSSRNLRRPPTLATRLAVIFAGSTLMGSAGAYGADTSQVSANASQGLQEVVVSATPIEGATINADQVPGTVQMLSSSDLTRQGTASLTTALNSTLGSVEINDNLDDPFQPDILFRGFEASPVLGTPEGLAVYQNGVRINEAFGDTVNWDLFPDVAIDSVQLLSSSPLYGLNALGGAMSVTMKNGFTYRGGELELSGGSFGYRSAEAQFGEESGPFALYLAGRALDSDGWRDSSRDTVRSLYADLSAHAERASLDLSYTRADNDLHGQSPAPAQELAVSRALVFTGPQGNTNTLNFFTLNGNLKISDYWSMQGVAYYRDFGQSVSNGNTTNYEACESPPGILCQPDGVTPLADLAGNLLPDISQSGTAPIGENDFEFLHDWGRGVSLQISNNASLLPGHPNVFSLGAAIDYASTSFYSAAQIGVLNDQLVVLPSDLVVYTPENSDAAIANGDATPVSVDSVNKNLGLYLTDTFDVTSKFSLTASARYNITNVDLIDQLGQNLTGFNRFAHFNPAVGGTYKLLKTMTLYGGVSTNTRTPTASEIECSNPLNPCLLPSNLSGDPPHLRQVVAHTFELGLRGTVAQTSSMGDLAWNVDAFRTNLHDDIYGVATSVSQGFFQNIGDTQRRGVELGLNVHADRLSAFLNYSFVQATFQSAFLVPSPSNYYQDANGDIQVEPGDLLPGVPENRFKIGGDYRVLSSWSVGGTVNVVGSSYYDGDQANLLAPLSSYTVVELHTTYSPLPRLQLFASITNLFNAKYSTYGILSDPTGVGAPGVPADEVTNGPGVDNRFLSPAAPLEIYGGIRLQL